MVMVAAVALIIAGFLWVFRPPVVIVELAKQPQRANTDHHLFEIVLSDLIENEDLNPATGGCGVEKPQLVFGDITRGGFSELGWNLDASIREKNVPSVPVNAPKLLSSQSVLSVYESSASDP
jgi:hypothetical protein